MSSTTATQISTLYWPTGAQTDAMAAVPAEICTATVTM
jgi:hypothetical protein